MLLRATIHYAGYNEIRYKLPDAMSFLLFSQQQPSMAVNYGQKGFSLDSQQPALWHLLGILGPSG